MKALVIGYAPRRRANADGDMRDTCANVGLWPTVSLEEGIEAEY